MLLMTYAAKSTSALGGSATRAAIQTVTGFKNLIRAWLHRREVMQLGELDERGLKDIGLVRSDVEGALATSWLRDPSAVLSVRSAQQQSAAASRREAGLRQAVAKPAVAKPAVDKPAAAPARAIEIACNA